MPYKPWHSLRKYQLPSILMLAVISNKAFDKVPHDKIIIKMRTVGITGAISEWYGTGYGIEHKK